MSPRARKHRYDIHSRNFHWEKPNKYETLTISSVCRVINPQHRGDCRVWVCAGSASVSSIAAAPRIRLDVAGSTRSDRPALLARTAWVLARVPLHPGPVSSLPLLIRFLTFDRLNLGSRRSARRGWSFRCFVETLDSELRTSFCLSFRYLGPTERKFGLEVCLPDGAALQRVMRFSARSPPSWLLSCTHDESGERWTQAAASLTSPTVALEHSLAKNLR